jgi:ComF family protein
MIMDIIFPVKRDCANIRTIAQKTGIRGFVARLWPADCLLCLDPAHDREVCSHCERLLARSGAACLRCAIPLPVEGWCADCLRKPPAFDDVATAFDYRFPVDRLVHGFKFAADLAAGAYLGDALLHVVAAAPKPDLVVASPASPARLRERGFNPALVLARRVASRLGIAVDARVLAKVRHTPAQAGLDRPSRYRNLRGAFAVRRELAGLHVAVVDDVMTTGATLSEIARALKGAGAKRVSGWVVARTPEPPQGS